MMDGCISSGPEYKVLQNPCESCPKYRLLLLCSLGIGAGISVVMQASLTRSNFKDKVYL